MPPKKKAKVTAKSKCTEDGSGYETTTGEPHRKLPRPNNNAEVLSTTNTRSASSENDKESHENANKVQKYWLMKAEPESRIENGVDVKFGVDDLMKEPNQTACWDGVRNYQARNFMRDQMSVGDLAFFYHRYSLFICEPR